MTPVTQRTKTDCLTACVASITGLPYEDCPQLWDLTGIEWLKALRDWGREHGFGVAYFNIHAREFDWPYLDGMHVIVVGNIIRSTQYDHSVIALCETEDDGLTRLNWVHDPAVGEHYLLSVNYIVMLVKL